MMVANSPSDAIPAAGSDVVVQLGETTFKDVNNDGQVDKIKSSDRAIMEGLQVDADGFADVNVDGVIDSFLVSSGLDLGDGNVNSKSKPVFRDLTGNEAEVYDKAFDDVAGDVSELAQTEASDAKAPKQGAKDGPKIPGGASKAGHQQSYVPDASNRYADVQGKFGDLAALAGVNGELDVNALVQAVIRQSYLESTKDLQFYAQKVKFYNKFKDGIRGHLKGLRQLMSLQAGRDDQDKVALKGEGGSSWSSLAGKGVDVPQVTEFDTTPVFDPASGQYLPSKPKTLASWEGKTKNELETTISNTEELLSAVGDDAQLANVDLQNMLQKQQQTLQLMSNISKMLHDTGMAIIRKIG